MKSNSFLPVVAVLIIVLVLAVQEVQLVNNWGRRFGRSFDKKYSPGRTLRRSEVQFYRQQAFPRFEDENGRGQPLDERVSILR